MYFDERSALKLRRIAAAVDEDWGINAPPAFDLEPAQAYISAHFAASFMSASWTHTERTYGVDLLVDEDGRRLAIFHGADDYAESVEDIWPSYPLHGELLQQQAPGPSMDF